MVGGPEKAKYQETWLEKTSMFFSDQLPLSCLQLGKEELNLVN
jgi:hypothetical protein